MGFYQSEYWLSDTWGANRQERRSGTYHPYAQDFLCNVDLILTAEAAAAVSQAQTDIALLNANARHLTDTEPLARLILRAEAVASSKIEGLEMSAGMLLEYEALDELGVHHRLDGTEAAVLTNIGAMHQSIEAAALDTPFSVASLCDIDAMLLAGTDMEPFSGVLRDRQNWIGCNNVNPLGAAYVPPKPEYVPELMDDLAAFINTSPLPPLVVAAIAHAQLETVLPFANGNGRTGRAIVHAILRKVGLTTQVTTPISLILATDKERYISNLAAFRTDSANPSRTAQEAMNDWVEYFAHMTSEACSRAQQFETALTDVQSAWTERVRPRANSAAALLISRLIGNPVVSVESAARLTGRSYEAARNAISSLTAASVLTQNARNRKSNLYVAKDVIDTFTRYERSLATISGDTKEERPARVYPSTPNVRKLAGLGSDPKPANLT